MATSFRFFFALLLVALILPARAQRVDTLIKKINLYGAANPDPVLFLHVDKTVYVANEEIWFTAYLLNCDTISIKAHTTLSFALVRNDAGKLILNKQFVMSDGLSFGNVSMPDTISPGNYTIIAHTGQMRGNQPAVIFKQPITVKSAGQPAIAITMDYDTVNVPAGKIKVTLRAQGPNALNLIGAQVNYNIGGKKHGVFSFSGTTGVTGENEILLDRASLTPVNRILIAEVKNGKQTEHVSLTLPVRRLKTAVKFYPEGGYLVAGIKNAVGWEARGTTGEALKLSAIILKNNQPVDTVETDSYGMGTFELKPQAAAIYQAKIVRAGIIDTIYNLPTALPRGVAINIKDALPKDSILISLTSTRKQLYKVLIHNYRDVFFSFDMETSPMGRQAVLNARNLPRGLTMVTVLDSLNRPCAERTFFANYTKRPALTLSTNQAEFAKRQKVSVNIKLNEPSKIDAKGFFSVACVQDNRMDAAKPNNIESYIYLTRQINDLPIKNDIMATDATGMQYMQELLLIKGWQRYTWLDMLKTIPGDTLINYSQISVKGHVNFDGKPLRKPVTLTSIRDSLMQIIYTDNTGSFTMSDAAMITPPDKRISLFINGKDKTQPYTIHVNQPFKLADEALAAEVDANNVVSEVSRESNTALALEGTEHARHLREVKITATKNDDLTFTVEKAAKLFAIANECGDFVCVNNILNCVYHRGEPDNRPPMEGAWVRVRNGSVLSNVRYHGCHTIKEKEYSSYIAVDGIFTNKEFYGADYSEISSTAPDYQSTIFWKHLIQLDGDKPADFSFYTNDITGRFRIVVQGAASDDVVYGETFFTVRK